MNRQKILTKTILSLIGAFLTIIILVPFFLFISFAFLSNNEMYDFPKSFVPKFSHELKIEYKDDVYVLSVKEQDGSYDELYFSDKARDFKRYLSSQLAVDVTEEQIEKDFEPAKLGEPVYLKYKKDMFYNFKTFFLISNNATGALMNSLKAALYTIIISLGIGSMAGYSLARYNFKGKDSFSLMILVVRMFPGVAVSIPMMIYLLKMGLDNTMIGLSIVYAIGNIGLTAWVTSSIFMGINKELEEASLIFGSTKFQSFYKITLPLAVPGLIASSMYAFLAAWNDSIVALILSSENPTLSLLVYKAVGTSTEYQYATVGAIILIIPALIFTYIVKNYINQLWGDVSV